MIEKAERAIFGYGNKPEREFGEFDSQRIKINTIDALLSNTAFPVGEISFTRFHCIFGLQAKLYQVASDILCYLDEKMSTSHRWVQDVDRQSRLYSLCIRLCILGTIVQYRPQGLINHVLDDIVWCIVAT